MNLDLNLGGLAAKIRTLGLSFILQPHPRPCQPLPLPGLASELPILGPPVVWPWPPVFMWHIEVCHFVGNEMVGKRQWEQRALREAQGTEAVGGTEISRTWGQKASLLNLLPE